MVFRAFEKLVVGGLPGGISKGVSVHSHPPIFGKAGK